MEELRGRTALITGASRGIGVHIARALVGRHVNVALVARDADALTRLASELRSVGVRARAIPYDLTDRTSLGSLVDRAEAEVGPIDILVNNAGLDSMRVFTSESDADIVRMVEVDLLAPMLLSRHMVPRMQANRSGHIVNIASLAGKAATPYSVAYSAAKAGLIAFTHSLRAELRDTGVRVTTVVPGFVRDEGMFAGRKGSGARAPRLLGSSTPEQVAKAVLRALFSDRAEIVVNPGPMRLLGALNQLSPDLVNWFAERMGVHGMMRKVALAERTLGPGEPPKPENDQVPPRASSGGSSA